ncbi:restriction endonuclease subunit S [Pseudoalteromonas sp. SSM20]|uniref:restriction endonuclease subunit S n=1 Tax=Pseudoalteromonas sp. SSM20 TaxID=3139394 RepID=UPI003BA9F845
MSKLLLEVMVQANNLPKLRFPEFFGNYESKKIEDITTRITKPVELKDDIEYTEIGIRSWGKGIFHKEKTSKEQIGNKRVFWLEPDLFIVNIVFAWEQALAKTTEQELGKIASHRFPMYKPKKEQVTLDYLVWLFLTNKGKYLLEMASPGGAGRNKTLGQKEFNRLRVNLPSLSEQSRVAHSINLIDKRISLLKEKYALLTQYKKGVMQKLFKQEIRFKDDNGSDFPDWQEQRFEQVFERVTRKNKEDNQNVLTISAQQGLINQEKYFNKSVSANDVTGYYLLEKGDFAYNKSYSKGYPMGAIKRLNNYDKGVVSTLYICFKSHGEQQDEFWEQYFEAGNLNREINKIAQEGARNHGLLNVSVTEFFHDVKVIAPCAEEQQKIADFLQALDKKLDAVNQQIELTQTFKKGLLQQMFV